MAVFRAIVDRPAFVALEPDDILWNRYAIPQNV